MKYLTIVFVLLSLAFTAPANTQSDGPYPLPKDVEEYPDIVNEQRREVVRTINHVLNEPTDANVLAYCSLICGEGIPWNAQVEALTRLPFVLHGFPGTEHLPAFDAPPLTRPQRLAIENALLGVMIRDKKPESRHLSSQVARIGGFAELPGYAQALEIIGKDPAVQRIERRIQRAKEAERKGKPSDKTGIGILPTPPA